MATTDARTGFRLPWTADRTNDDDPGPAAGEATDDADAEAPMTVDEHPAEVAGEVAEAPSPSDAGRSGAPATAPGPARRPTKFLADLTRAMQAAAEQAREQTLGQFQADSKAFIELIHETTAGDAVAIKRTADEDVAAIRDWSKAEMARIREETEARIGARKAELEQELERHAASIEARIELVHRAVAAFESEMAAFFEHLLREDDPTAFAALAENLPEPPRLEDIVPETIEPTSAIGAPAEPVAGPAEVAEPTTTGSTDDEPSAASAEPAATAGAADWTDARDSGASDATADVAAIAAEPMADPESATTPGIDLDAAEAEAALAARAESTGDDGDAFMSRLQGLTGGDQSPVGEARSTQVLVAGLISVASIASFKRHLARTPGVDSVGVSSGPNGEFVFTVVHGTDVDLATAIPTRPGFAARITGTGEGVVHAAASDPEAGS